MEKAPFRDDLAEGPGGAFAVWRRAADGVRLRIAGWRLPAARGTVIVFPGRTENVEKYGRVARFLVEAGYSVIAIDWRGQGLSDRLTRDARLGHVGTFADYQLDVDAYFDAAGELEMPQPWLMLAHSMGGCIGYRALSRDVPVARVAFSAPMWGIYMSPALRPVARGLPWVMGRIGRTLDLVPGTFAESYVLTTPFAENLLTTDRDHYDYLARQARAEPRFALGGPTIHWLGAAMAEMQALIDLPHPTLPALTYLGTEEQVVDPAAIQQMHATWPTAALRIVPGARHELLMEAPALREPVLDGIRALFDAETGS